MKILRLLLLPLIAAVSLASCKANIDTEINVSDLISSPTKAIPSDLHLEVTSCNDYKDSREPSKAVMQAKEQIPAIFSDAKYVECFKKEMDSFAHFRLPVVLDKEPGERLASEEHLNIVSNEKTLLMLGIPKSIKMKLEQAKRNIFGLGSINLSVLIKINNDTSDKFSFNVFSAYIDGVPFVIDSLEAKPGQSILLQLSDVSVDQALQRGVSLILASN